MLDDQVTQLGLLFLGQVGVRLADVEEVGVAALRRDEVREQKRVLGAVLVEGRVGVWQGVACQRTLLAVVDENDW